MNACPELTEYLRHHAGEYFNGLGSGCARVELLQASRRVNSTLHALIIGDGVAEYSVLAKMPTPPKPSRSDRPEPPLLFPKVHPGLKNRFEYRTMSAIQRHIGSLADPRFTAVRVYGLLPDERALLMEKVSDRSLSEWMRSQPRLGPEPGLSQRLRCIVRNAGAWLRHYHSMPILEHTRRRAASRANFIESIVEFAQVAGDAGQQAFFERVSDELTELAESHLPEMLPLGLCHSDFTPSNVLAGPDGRVCVIDTLGRWKAPIYEDISRFLTVLKTPSPPSLRFQNGSREQAAARLEEQFLIGYFDDQPVPLPAVRLFECQALLARAAAFAHQRREARGWKKVAKRGRELWWNGYLARVLPRLLAEARNEPAASTECVTEVAV